MEPYPPDDPFPGDRHPLIIHNPTYRFGEEPYSRTHWQEDETPTQKRMVVFCGILWLYIFLALVLWKLIDV